METSQQFSDGDIVANVLHEMAPEADQVDSDDDNESTEADDAFCIDSISWFLHIVTHQRFFVQWNKFPSEVVQQLQAFGRGYLHQQVKTSSITGLILQQESSTPVSSKAHPHLHLGVLTSWPFQGQPQPPKGNIASKSFKVFIH